jgi:hypothetical protein
LKQGHVFEDATTLKQSDRNYEGIFLRVKKQIVGKERSVEIYRVESHQDIFHSE